MKSKSFRTISTLIIGASAFVTSVGMAPSTYATDISASRVDPSLLPVGTEIDGKRYWTVEEMQTASDLISAKREEYCQGDRTCKEELPWQQMSEFGGIYRALDPFENIHFMLTSVNPSRNTVKFLYHDEDKMMSRMFGETVRYDIASIYAVWVDESLGSITTTSSNWLAYGQRAPYHLGSAEEVEAATHLIFDESENELGRGWFTPNVEREYYVEGSNLTDNTRAQIHFSMNATDGGGHSHGTLDYSSCINSPNYTDGMECRMMYGEDGTYYYFSFTPEAATTNPEPTTDPEPTVTEPTIEPTPAVEPTNPDSTEVINEPSTTTSDTEVKERVIYAVIKDPTSTQSQPLSIASSPRTVYVTASTSEKQGTTTPTEEDKTDTITKSPEPTANVEVPLAATPTNTEEEHVFPWWLVVLMFFGSAFIIFSWWFLLPLFKRRDDEDE